LPSALLHKIKKLRRLLKNKRVNKPLKPSAVFLFKKTLFLTKVAKHSTIKKKQQQNKKNNKNKKQNLA